MLLILAVEKLFLVAKAVTSRLTSRVSQIDNYQGSKEFSIYGCIDDVSCSFSSSLLLNLEYLHISQTLLALRLDACKRSVD
jgi:hypothetical protein